MALQLRDRSVLLTGASSGIGAATAMAVARRGARLGLVARREDRLAEVADACIDAGSPEVALWPTDLSDLDAAESVAREAQDRFGALDVLVNNAGRPMRRRVTELGAAHVEATMTLNYFAPVRMALAVLPAMVVRNRGCIANVSSVGGRFPILGEAAYCGSKAALCGFTETLAADLHGTGVDVRLILPGPIDTEIWDQPDQEDPFYDGPLEPPEVVADGIVAAIEGDGIEHWLPNLKPVAEMKYADLDGFIAGMVASVSNDTEQDP